MRLNGILGRVHIHKRVLLTGLRGFVLLVVLAGAASAQTPEEREAAKLDTIAANLQIVDTKLQRHDLGDQDLQNLRDELMPFGAELANVIARFTPRLAAVETRIAQLGPAPDPKGPPEDPHITADRAEQQKTHDAIDALLKRARLMAVQIDQTETQISTRRRVIFAHSLFERSASPLTPSFWRGVAGDLPRDAGSVRALMLDWVGSLGGRLAGWRLPAFVGLLALVVAICWPLSVMAQRVRSRERAVGEPTPIAKYLAAWWITFVVASLPIAALFAIGGIFQIFDLLDPRFDPVTRAFAGGVSLIAFTAGLGRAVLYPPHENWRLVGVSDEASETILRFALILAGVVSLVRIDEAIADAVGASVATQAAVRGLGAVIVGIIIAVSLWRAGTKQLGNDDVFGPLVSAVPDWSGPVRIIMWGLAAAIIISALAGFSVLAGFLVDQIVWVTGVVTVAMMASGLLTAAVAAGFQPATPFGRNLAAIVGLPQSSLDQLAVLLGGAIRVVAMVIALLLILAPWGLQSADMPGYFRTAFLGIRVDDLNISLAGIGVAVVVFAAGYAITRGLVRWLDTTYLPHTSLDIGLRNAIKTSLGYIGISLSVLFSLAAIGVSFEKLAIVASALSIGIGFGLQSIVNNFVSGLILLWERTIRTGDWIVVGADEGFVRRINVRSTEIQTFDRATVIVPNSNLVSGIVKNFVRTDRVGRVKITFPIDLSADAAKAREALEQIVKSHDLVLETPAPLIVLNSFDAAHINFEIYCFVADIATTISVKSALNFQILQKFKQEGWLFGPLPASVVTLAGLDKFEPLLKAALAEEKLGKAAQNG